MQVDVSEDINEEGYVNKRERSVSYLVKYPSH
jgi:hypothetical protein